MVQTKLFSNLYQACPKLHSRARRFHYSGGFKCHHPRRRRS